MAFLFFFWKFYSFTFMSIFHSYLILVQSVMFRQRSIVLHIYVQLFQYYLVKQYTFSISSSSLLKNQFSGCVCRFCSVDLSVYPFVNIMFLDCFKFTVILKTGQCKSFNFALLFQNCLKLFIPFTLCLNHRISFFCIYNNSGILLELCYICRSLRKLTQLH